MTRFSCSKFIKGDVDTFEVGGELSMWRVDGVVYAVGIHRLSRSGHRDAVNAYLEHQTPGCGFRYRLHYWPLNSETEVTFGGNPVGHDEVLTLHQDRLGMHNAYPNQKVST